MIADIVRLLVVPVPLKVPLVAPVTVMLSTVRVVGSTLKDKVSPVVVTELLVPPVWTALWNVTSISDTAPVAGKTAVTVPEPAVFVAVAPATVKLSAATPVSVQPVFGVSTRFAVYTVLAAKVEATAGLQLMVPVYWSVSMAVVTGVALRTGTVIPGIANKDMV